MLSGFDSDEILKQFPPVVFAFAYGSGVIEQNEYFQGHLPPQTTDGSSKGAAAAATMPMVDLIFAVDDSASWHLANIAMNPSHYTPFLPISATHTAKFQEGIPAHLWFNTYIPMNLARHPGRHMKYGVISRDHLLQDLSAWTDLYAAGRLHKPVRILRGDPQIERCMETNREQAVRSSLLLLPERFSDLQLYLTIASLSYGGDPRMLFGENPRKVVNLVTPIVNQYRSLYRCAVQQLSSSVKLQATPIDRSEGVMFRQDTSRGSRVALCAELAPTVKHKLSVPNGSAAALSSSGYRPPLASAVRTVLARIVMRAATLQTLKGVFTVGILKGSRYIWSKIGKRFAPATAAATGSS